jgi:hypothetical protein
MTCNYISPAPSNGQPGNEGTMINKNNNDDDDDDDKDQN